MASRQVPVDISSLEIPDIDGDLKSVQKELGATFDVGALGIGALGYCSALPGQVSESLHDPA
jgi:hypothetical protein